MTARNLKLVGAEPPEPPKPTPLPAYVEIPASVRLHTNGAASKVRQLQTTLCGSFSTGAKVEDALATFDRAIEHLTAAREVMERQIAAVRTQQLEGV